MIHTAFHEVVSYLSVVSMSATESTDRHQLRSRVTLQEYELFPAWYGKYEPTGATEPAAGPPLTPTLHVQVSSPKVCLVTLKKGHFHDV